MNEQWFDTVKKDVTRPIAAGVIALTIGFGGFGAWAAVAPLEGSIIANGTVAASGRNKIVQHLEGGIIKEILVSEGDRVAQGQVLLMMDRLSAEANRNRVRSDYFRVVALEARAEAERVNSREITFPAELLSEPQSEELVRAMRDQVAELGARLDSHDADVRILEQQTAALREKILGLQAQQKAVEMQLELVGQERSSAEQLLQQKLISNSRVLELKRTEAELAGQSGQLIASIAEAKQLIAEKEEQRQRVVNARIEEASQILGEARRQRADLQEQLRTAEDALARVAVRAPVQGTVIDLTQHGAGAVLAAGQKVLEIVPDAAELIVEVHIRPQDVNQVRVGQSANLMFAALAPRQTTPVLGKVTYLSADRLENERTGESYYLARLSIAEDLTGDFDLSAVGAGQPVEVFITTGQRTFLSYVTDPFADTIRRGLRE
jgi:HlyD family secretion protein